MAVHSNIVHSGISFLRSGKALSYLSLGIPMVSFSQAKVTHQRMRMATDSHITGQSIQRVL